MKAYPSIGFHFDPALRYHVFDKIDGSNLRAEWSPKRGFYKFGTRTRLLGSDQPTLWPAQEKFLERYGDALAERLLAARCPSAVAFFEYAGPSSFAGSHSDPVEAMTVTLFDIAVHQKGLLPPEQFLALSEGLPTPRLLHQGRITPEFIEAVQAGQMPGLTFEGVVGKGPFSQPAGGPLQFKLKTRAWLSRLKDKCAGDDALFERLR